MYGGPGHGVQVRRRKRYIEPVETSKVRVGSTSRAQGAAARLKHLIGPRGACTRPTSTAPSAVRREDGAVHRPHELGRHRAQRATLRDEGTTSSSERAAAMRLHGGERKTSARCLPSCARFRCHTQAIHRHRASRVGIWAAGLAHIGYGLVTTLYDGHAGIWNDRDHHLFIDADVHSKLLPETVGTARPSMGPMMPRGRTAADISVQLDRHALRR